MDGRREGEAKKFMEDGRKVGKEEEEEEEQRPRGPAGARMSASAGERGVKEG